MVVRANRMSIESSMRREQSGPEPRVLMWIEGEEATPLIEQGPRLRIEGFSVLVGVETRWGGSPAEKSQSGYGLMPEPAAMRWAPARAATYAEPAPVLATNVER